MGIKNLQKLIDAKAKDAVKTITKNELKGKTLAIDTSLMVHQVVSAIRSSGTEFTNESGKVTTHIVGIFNKVKWFMENEIKIIFVFDGKPPSIKQGTLDDRTSKKEKAQSKIDELSDGDEENKIKLSQQTFEFNEEYANDIKQLLDFMGVPYIQAPEEADSVCAQLVKEKVAWGVVSNDRDILTFGATHLLYNFKTGDKEYKYISLPTLLKSLKLTHDEFIDLCILLECDYTPKIKGIGFNRAYDIIQEFSSISAFLASDKAKKLTVPHNYNYKEAQNYFKNPPVAASVVVKHSKVKWDKLQTFLVDVHNFDYTVIQKQLDKLKKKISS